MGRTEATDAKPLLDLDRGSDGTVSVDRVAAGTYPHGLLEQPEPRHGLVRALSAARGYAWQRLLIRPAIGAGSARLEN
jgi:cobyric acid synthase